MVFSLFWRKAWDNLGHVVILNMLWLTLAIPTGLAIYSVWVTVVTTSQAPAVAQAGVSPDEAAALSPGAPQPGAPAPTGRRKASHTLPVDACGHTGGHVPRLVLGAPLRGDGVCLLRNG